MHEFAIMFLCILPFVIIGFVGGMLFMRAQYLEIIRSQRKQIYKMTRKLN